MRKLALSSSAFAASVFAAEYLLMPNVQNKICFVWLALAFFLTGTLLCILFHRRCALAGVCVICFGTGLFCYWSNYILTTVQAETLAGKQTQFTAEALTWPEETETGERMTVILRFSKGTEERACDGLKCIVYSDEEAFAALKPGDYFSMKGYFRSSEEKYGEDYDGYRSKGIYLLCTGKSSPVLTDFDEGLFCALRSHLNAGVQWLSHTLKSRIQTVFSGESAAFFEALMTGDKAGLYDCEDLYTAMSHAGITHIVAVSGMHVAYLIAVLQLLLGRKRSSAILSIGLVWIFVMVTGGSASAARAAFMQTVLLMAPVLRRENDTLTSLAFALAVLLFLNPYAAASVSLQLSFAAVAGICLFSDKISGIVTFEKRKKLPDRILHYFWGIAATSLSVMVFTAPLAVVHFGYISLYSILTNLLCLWAVPVCFCGGYIVIMLSWVFPLAGGFGAYVLSFLAENIIFRVCLWVSALPHAVLYFSNSLSFLWLILVYLLFLGFALLKIRTVWKVLIPAGVSIGLLFAMYMLITYMYTYTEPTITVLDVGQGECITAFSGNRTVVIDCGSVFTQENAGDVAGQFLNGAQRTTVDLLILSHLDEDHMNGILNLCRYVTVKRIVMPLDENEDDAENLQTVEECAAKLGITPKMLRWGAFETENELSVSMELYYSSEGSNEDCFFVTLSYQNFDMLFSGDNPEENEIQYVQDHPDLSDIDLLIVGHHGSKYSSCEEYLQAVNPDKADKPAVISVGYNTYGHPTTEALDRLKEWGYTVYRTDQDGNVTIRLNQNGTFSVG